MQFAEEKLTPAWFKEALPLLQEHWLECACWTDKIQLDVDEQKYMALNKANLLYCYTMRDNGVLAGYIVVLSIPSHMHYKSSSWAYVDVLFIHKEHRKGLTAIKFMKWVEQEVTNRGVDVMSYHVKTFHDYPAIFEHLGFNKIETIYAKYLKE